MELLNTEVPRAFSWGPCLQTQDIPSPRGTRRRVRRTALLMLPPSARRQIPHTLVSPEGQKSLGTPGLGPLGALREPQEKNRTCAFLRSSRLPPQEQRAGRRTLGSLEKTQRPWTRGWSLTIRIPKGPDPCQLRKQTTS